MRPPRAWLVRLIIFIAVGTLCFAVQSGVLVLAHGLGAGLLLANAIGFVVSAQVNFGLSAAFTWGDRPASTGRQLVGRWATSQFTFLGALLVNTVVFAAALPLVPMLAAAAAGVVAGAGASFAASHVLVFRPRPAGTGKLRMPEEVPA